MIKEYCDTCEGSGITNETINVNIDNRNVYNKVEMRPCADCNGSGFNVLDGEIFTWEEIYEEPPGKIELSWEEIKNAFYKTRAHMYIENLEDFKKQLGFKE